MTKLRALLLSALLAPAADAQCSDWTAGFGPRGTNEAVNVFATHDDGSGPALYVGGRFTSIGPIAATRVARWNGSAFEPLGAGVGSIFPHAVHAMVSFDDGSGSALVVGGEFTSAGGSSASNIARWDGSAWTPLGAGFDRAVHSLAVFDSGAGPELYAGGNFGTSGGNPVTGIARWDGAAWQALGTGLASDGFHLPDARALAVYQSKLFVGGTFLDAGGLATRSLAAWDGTAWSLPAGASGLSEQLTAGAFGFATFDDGSGPKLYVGGDFHAVDGAAIRALARYDGASWSAVPGSPYRVNALQAFDAGSGVGPALWVASGTQIFPGVHSDIARFDGASWTTPGSGVDTWNTGQSHYGVSTTATRAFATWSPNGAPEVLAAGEFQYYSDVEAWNLASYDGASWRAVHAGNGPDDVVEALARVSIGGGEALYAGGRFHRVGGQRANSIARWDGRAWTTLGSGANNGVYNGLESWLAPGIVSALCAYDSGAGQELWVGGQFARAGGITVQNLARWDGTGWSAANFGFTAVAAMLVHDDGSGPALFIVGRTGTGPSCTLKRWDGTTATTIGVFGSAATCLAEFQGDLYVAGDFWEVVGTLSTKCFARWDGTSWHAVGDPAGAALVVRCMTVHDDGTGPALYAGGRFATVSFVPSRNVVRWDGSAFTDVGGGIGSAAVDQVLALDSFDGRLLAFGNFDDAGGAPALRAASWDGTAWSQVGDGIGRTWLLNGITTEKFDDGTGLGESLYVGGEFTGTGPHAASNLARLAHCGEEATTFCHGDGSAAACPCGNASASGDDAGCLNSFGLGATLRVHGRASLSQDTLELRGARMTNSSALYFQAGNVVNGGLGFAFGDGVKCTAGPFVRLATKVNAGGASSYPQPGNLPISVRGFVTAPGTRHYQVHYRNSAAFCAPETFNMTNAVTVRWEP